MTRALGALLFVVLSPFAAATQAASPARSEYLVEVWDTDRGLPSSSVTSLASTPDGYLWIGTFEGLTRFDGLRFTVVTHGNTPDFPDDGVTALHTDRSGNLWAATGKGIVRCERGKWRRYAGPSGELFHFATQIAEDETGRILAISGNQLYGLSGDRFAALPMPPKRHYLRVFAVPGKGIWGNAENYFGRYRDGRWEEIESPADLKTVLGAQPGAHGIWVAGPKGIRGYEDGKWSPLMAAPSGFGFIPPITLLEDTHGNVWAGDYRSGLAVFRKDGTTRLFGRLEGLPHQRIRRLFEGPEEGIWAATDGGGLFRLRRHSVTMFEESDGLIDPVVDSVFEEAPGSLLAGTYGGGLSRFNEGTGQFEAPLTAPGRALQPTSLVLSVLGDGGGGLWASIYERGLIHIEGGKAAQIAAAGQWNIEALFLDAHQTLWMGYQGGVASYANGQLTRYATQAGAPRSEITQLAGDGQGDLWMGGMEGLFRLHGGQFEKFTPPGIREYAPVTCLYGDDSGSLWIGTRERGLDRLQNGKFTAYGPEQGLAATRIGGILEDNEGHLWLATQRQGLVGVTRASLDAVAAGKQAQLSLVWLSRDDGLTTNQLRIGFQPAAWKGTDGRLWFATLKGLAMLDPKQLGNSASLPPVRIEDITVGDRHIPIEEIAGDKLTLPAGSRGLRFSFTRPSFRGAERIRFQYGLEGLDATWVDATERSASFGDLRPGDYSFRVRASDGDGLWNPAVAKLKIVVQPFYWETLWFRLAVVLALVAITGVLVYLTQSRKLKSKTEQLEKEQALRRDIEKMQAVLKISEERFAKAFDSSPTPMSISTLADGEFLDVNQRFLESTGFRREEVIGRRRNEFGLWLDQKEADRFTETIKVNKRLRNFEARLKAAKGNQGYHLLSTEAIELNGRPCVLVSSDEITDRRLLEEQLNQAQKLESIGRLAGGVAHDFNNLLTVINGYSDLVLRRLDPDDSNWDRVGQIRKAGERAAELTRQLLAFSRKQVIKPRAFDLNELIRDTEPLLRRLLPESIAMFLHLGGDAIHVMADHGQLSQVLLNLAANARDAMPEGGELTVETMRAHLDAQFAQLHPGVVPGMYALLAIRDTGVGMSDEVRKQIFEPFFTTKKKGAGTGLGLATVYGIVRQNGGWIWVDSAPNEGSVFRIYLPGVSETVVERKPAAPQAISERGWETVLVVEDQEDVRHLACEVLQSCGYMVLEAAHGAEAVRLAEQHEGPIHLMLTDVVMPGMTGKEIAERMRTIRPATKVLYMSGYAVDVIAKQGVIDPGIAFIAKPLSPDALAAKVRETLGPLEAE